jgi:hypothetical protein
LFCSSGSFFTNLAFSKLSSILALFCSLYIPHNLFEVFLVFVATPQHQTKTKTHISCLATKMK